MKIVSISLIVVTLIVNARAKPTFDVIADIIHDLVHDPNLPENHRPPPYVHNGAYTQNGYNRPGYTHVVYGYNQRPHQEEIGVFYPNNSPNGYYPNNLYDEYYPPTGTGIYTPGAVYDNQGYYKGPPYASNKPNGYNYNNRQYGLRGN